MYLLNIVHLKKKRVPNKERHVNVNINHAHPCDSMIFLSLPFFIIDYSTSVSQTEKKRNKQKKKA